MKKVVSKSEVPHLWANQLQHEARVSGGNFYFNGLTIYSYGTHFPIASISSKDSNIVYFTTRGYSNTTAKHISETSHACNHKTKIYCHNPLDASKGYHRENIEQFEKEAKNIAQKLPKSKKPEIYLTQIARQRDMLSTYAQHFGIDLSKYALTYIDIVSKTGANEATEQEKINIAKAEKLRIAKQKREHTKQLKEFRAFERARLYLHSGFDYLRFNPETNRIETSQSVEMPLKSAKTLYTNVLKTVKTGKCTVCGEKFMEAYEIKEINKDFIIVGCHKVAIKEIQMLATQLGW